jgi:cytochrome c oxidase subunit 3
MQEHRDYKGAKMGMWIFLLTEVLLFGGMFLLYSVYRYRFFPDFHAAASDLNKVIGTINTIVLLTSSLTIALSISAIRKGQRRLSIILQGATIFFGIVFLINKYFEWSEKFHHGLYIGSPKLTELGHGQILFFSLYYVMTGLHGLHVLIGVTVISFMLTYTARGSVHQTDFIKLENTGLYWHLVDIIWIYLFPLFYLVT